MPVFLTDFGLARDVATGSRLTRTGEAPGTPAYMSPEQVRAEVALTPASDVWALGCVLYELLAGRRAFEGDGPAAVIGAALAAAPVSLGRVRPDLPAAAGRLVAACLAGRARWRPTDAAALRDDLDRVRRGDAPRARPPRRWGRVAVAGIALAGAAALAALAAAGGARTERRPLASAADDRVARLAAEASALRSDPVAAAARLIAALAVAPARHDLRAELGLQQWAAGRGAEAREAWAGIPDTDPSAELARLYAALESLLRLAGDEPMAHLDWIAARGGRHASFATAAMAALRREWPAARAGLAGLEGWPASLMRAHVEQSDPAGDRAAAIHHLTAVLASGPRAAILLTDRGRLRMDLGDDDAALADWDAALAIDPDQAVARACRAHVRLARGDAAAALADVEAALAIDPSLVRALVLRGVIRSQGDDPGQALADFDRALALEPRHAPARCNRALLRAELGDLTGAHQDLDAVLAANPRDAQAYYYRGVLRAATNDAAGARADYDAALAAAPPDWPLRPRVERLLADARGNR